MMPVRELLPDAVLDAIRRAPLSDEKVQFAWRFAVGAVLARSTTGALRGGVMYVRASTPHWGQEVERSRSLILARLASILGDDRPRIIRIEQ